MGVTTIKRLENRSRSTVTLLNVENRNAPGSGRAVAPGERVDKDMDNWIPWAGSGDFATKHLEVQFNGVTRFWIWQALNADGDHVRFSVDGRWHDRGEPVDGISAVDGDRTLVVFDDGVQLVDVPVGFIALLRGVLATDRYRLDRSVRLAARSVPKLTTSTFSVPGFASDTMVPLYRDTGKRYEFSSRAASWWRSHPDGRAGAAAERGLLRRAGGSAVRGAPRRPFDMIAAGGGRSWPRRATTTASTSSPWTRRSCTGGRRAPSWSRARTSSSTRRRTGRGEPGRPDAPDLRRLRPAPRRRALPAVPDAARRGPDRHDGRRGPEACLAPPRPAAGVGINGLIAAAMVHLAIGSGPFSRRLGLSRSTGSCARPRASSSASRRPAARATSRRRRVIRPTSTSSTARRAGRR